MSYLKNPTKYHLEQISETLHNSFNGSKVRPTNLRIDTTQSYVPGHIKQKSKSFKVDLNQNVNTQSSTMSSLLPETINEKIHELYVLIPDNFLKHSSTGKPSKSVVLRKVVEYIKHLKQLVGEQQKHNIVLENTLRDMKPE
ncbi:4571_t:CDS:2, partial [Racocetra fulgida]